MRFITTLFVFPYYYTMDEVDELDETFTIANEI